MIRTENTLMTCYVCDNAELSYVARLLYATGAQRTRYFCEWHRPEQFIPDREQRDHRYQTGYFFVA